MVLTLCGSNRFEAWFKMWNEALTLAGHCVFTLGVYPSYKEGLNNWYTDEEKVILDRVHKEKIRHSAGIVLLNPFGYIGDSTLSELAHVHLLGKKVFALESWAKGNGIGENHRDDVRGAARDYGVPAGFVSPVSTTEYRDTYSLLGPGGPFRSTLVDRILKAEDLALRRAVEA